MSGFSERQSAFLQEIGVGPLWVRRNIGSSAEESQPVDALSGVASVTVANIDPPSAIVEPAVSDMNWVQLKATVAVCTKCGLCRQRTNTVFGVGDEQASWLFVGEGPGRNEDAQGEPFVGKAGQLLDNMLLALRLKRGADAYIANIVKCRPTDAGGKDRPPSAAESDACLPYLQRQIALIRPKVIVALGKTAALALLQRDPDTPVSSLRGTVHRYLDVPLIVTYHPAYLLRTPADKRKAWADLCLARQSIGA